MPHHPVLVGIGDGALFERGHGGERLCEPRLHRGEEVIRERHAAQIERQPKRGIVVTVLFETGPGHRIVRKTGERKPEAGNRRKEKRKKKWQPAGGVQRPRVANRSEEVNG